MMTTMTATTAAAEASPAKAAAAADANNALVDEVKVPKTMVEALEWDDPEAALRALAAHAQQQAQQQAAELQAQLDDFDWTLPEILKLVDSNMHDHPVYAATACADSIYQSLTKIASGGSQASQEIRQLEAEKHEIDAHLRAVQTALLLRRQAERAQQDLTAENYKGAADNLTTWMALPGAPHESLVRTYTGEYCLNQLASVHQQLKQRLLDLYQQAVEKSDLQTLGKLTPILTVMQLEQDGVQLYVQFLQGLLQASLQTALAEGPPPGLQVMPPYLPMARLYNCAVAVLRHHLPMVSHCLHRAAGDAAVVQLVHAQVQDQVLPLWTSYQRDRQLGRIAQQAARIYAALEDRYTGRGLVEEDADHADDDDDDDCGFVRQVGQLSDVDAVMEETAMCLQHAESYLRFMTHTCAEVNKARQLRHEQQQQQLRLDRDRQEWATTTSSSKSSPREKRNNNDDGEQPYQVLEILPPRTNLHQSLAEVGGQYASIERCLMMASMQRAFVSGDSDARYYRPLSTSSHQYASSSRALQTSLVETCLYAARRGTQRAYATGHTGTASAMTNFCAETLTDVLLEALSHRAEELGVALLKPGEGLLTGSGGTLFHAQNLIRQGTHVVGAATSSASAAASAQPHHHYHKDEHARQQQIREGVAKACAVMNDLDVAAHHIDALEKLLNALIAKGFPSNTHDTEQLQMCVKGLGPVTDAFKVAADGVVESLESVLKSRVRAIVGEATGGESASAAAFMGSMGTGKMGGVVGGGGFDKVQVRMKYHLDEDEYNMMQVGESYVTRMCALLDELLEPLQDHLAPRLWDALLLQVMGTVCKRLETSLRKSAFTALGALLLDSDMRDLLSHTKDRLKSADYASNVAVAKACSPLSRLLQISKLLNVDDLDDVLDLISASKRKKNWDLKLDDAKAFLCLRVEFEDEKVHELLKVPDDD